MWLHFEVVVVGWKKVKSAAKVSIWAATEMAVFYESIVVSGAWYAVVWGSEDFSFVGQGLICCMTLCWEALEVFGVAIIVDIIKLLQSLESCQYHHIIFHLQATAQAQLNNDQFSIIFIIKIIISALNQRIYIYIYIH